MSQAIRLWSIWQDLLRRFDAGFTKKGFGTSCGIPREVLENRPPRAPDRPSRRPSTCRGPADEPEKHAIGAVVKPSRASGYAAATRWPRLWSLSGKLLVSL
jgi:hypothetical protein